jgi:hypothetical protein
MNGAFSSHYFFPTEKKRKTVYGWLSLALLFFISTNAQVYNYDPVRHSNFETNPSHLASGVFTRSISTTHHATLLSSDQFYYGSARISFYSKKLFSGAGLSLSTTRVNDSAAYSSAGIAFAYRTILFNKLYTKIGFMYKANFSTSQDVNFNYYSVTQATNEKSRGKFNQNINASLTFSSPEEKFYVSLGILNYTFAGKKERSQIFPVYYFLNIGDAGTIFDHRAWEIYYGGFAKTSTGSAQYAISNYITAIYSFPFTRSSKLRLGLRAGHDGENCLRYCPLVSWYQRIDKGRSFHAGFLLDFGYDMQAKRQIFSNATQVYFNYQF